MLAYTLTALLSAATTSDAFAPPPCSPPITREMLADAMGFVPADGSETWQHHADEIRDRALLGCLYKTYLAYPIRGKGSIAQAERDISGEIATLVRRLVSFYEVEVVIDGVEDVIPFATSHYASEDDYAAAAERHERRAEDRARTLARQMRALIPASVLVTVGYPRMNEQKGRRGVLVFVRHRRKTEARVASPPIAAPALVDPADPRTRRQLPPAAASMTTSSLRAVEQAPTARWMFSPYVRAFYVFGHGNTYAWDRGGMVASGMHFSRRFERWALEFSGEFRHASIRTALQINSADDPLSVRHYLFPVMLGVSHRGLVAGVEFAAGYLDERLYPDIPTRSTKRRVSLSTGLYAGVRLPLPSKPGPWVELGYLFSWVHSPRFPAFEQGLGHVHSLSVRVGWGFARRRHPG